MASAFLLLFVHQLPFTAHGQWIEGSPVKIDNEARVAVGANPNTGIISLLGGEQQVNRHDIVEFNITSSSFTRIDEFLSAGVFGEHQFSTQIGCNLYMMSTDFLNFHVYNVQTKQFAANISTAMSMPMVRSCVASSATHNALYVLNAVNTACSSNECALFLIYDISGDSWSNGPTPLTFRADAACMVNPVTGILYAIGGFSAANGGFLNTVEYIDTTTLSAWSYTADSLSVAVSRCRAVSVYDEVWLIGGETGSSHSDAVHVIHANHTVALHSDSLLFGVEGAASPVVLDNTLYVFGGNIFGVGFTNRWQYYALSGQTAPEPITCITADPTTAAPTTSDPTTAAPTTSDPTTAEPTTANPTTTTPTTSDPTTANPTTSEPTTAAPTTADPTTAAPTTGTPTRSRPRISSSSSNSASSEMSMASALRMVHAHQRGSTAQRISARARSESAQTLRNKEDATVIERDHQDVQTVYNVVISVSDATWFYFWFLFASLAVCAVAVAAAFRCHRLSQSNKTH